MKIIDLLAPVIIGVISVAFLMMTADLGRTAALFPKVLSITIIALIVLHIGVQIYLNHKNPPLKSRGEEAEAKDVFSVDVPRPNSWYIIVGSIGIYMGLMYLIGFSVASFIFGVALPYGNGYRRMKVVVPVSLGMTVGLVIIGKLFDIPLPAGLWMALL